MAPIHIDLKTTDDPRDVVHRAVQALAEGKIIAVPTETVYGLAASALNAAAVKRLAELKGCESGDPLALAIKSAESVQDFIPNLPPLAQRLARRCWPGPVTLVLSDLHPDSAVTQLPPSVLELIRPEKTIGFRVPAHQFLLAVLQLSPGPLALTSASRAEGPDVTTAEQVLETWGESVDLVLDDGKSRFGQPSSVVAVHDSGYNILREGVIAGPTLQRLSSFMILIVCTGNTCRSPMAEVMMQQQIADRLGVAPNQLEDRGIMVVSAGIAAMSGGRPSAESVHAMRARGLDLAGHESQPLTERLVKFADVILTMTAGHREAVLAQWPEARDRTHLLCRGGADVSDPIGGPQVVYDQCATQIEAELKLWIDEFEATRALTALGGE